MKQDNDNNLDESGKPKRETRSFSFTRESVNSDARTVELSFSSEAPYDRWWGREILDHSPGACDLSRLNGGGALLVDHNTSDQVGVTQVASISTDLKGRATVKFSRSTRGQEIFQDVQDGIRTLVSVGYEINKMAVESTEDGVETYRVSKWTPYEISLVSIPADPSVGVGRSAEKPTNPNEKMNKRILLDPLPTDGGGAPDIRKLEQDRCADIAALGAKYDMSTEAQKAIVENRSVEDFQRMVLEQKFNGSKPLAPAEEKPDIGMSAIDLRRYSLVRAIKQAAEGKLDGLELEASQATAKRLRKDPKGFFIPHDVARMSVGEARQTRALSTTSSSAGGFTVDSELLAKDMIELLRNKTLVAQLGARSLGGLSGNVLIPKVAGGATAYWLTDVGTATASDQSFQQLALVPHRLVGDTAYSKELLAQSSIDIEGFVRDDLMRVLAIAKDLAAINGTGAAGQPLGILNTTGLSTAITFGGVATWANVVAFESNIAANNADVASMAYLTTPATRGKWKTTVKVTNQAVFLWDNGNVNGYRAEVTNQVPSNKVIFGNWADLILADWAGMDVVVDPYSLKKTGQIEVTITLWTDVGVRHPVSFCVSTDSGAQ